MLIKNLIVNNIKIIIHFIISTTFCATSASLFAITDLNLEITKLSITQQSSITHKSLPLLTNNSEYGKIGEYITSTIESCMIGEFLTVEELAIINLTSNGARNYLAIPLSCEHYAKCIVNDQAVPLEIKAILTYVTDKKKRAAITSDVAKQIVAYTDGIFHRKKPMPDFLNFFFRPVTLAELEHIPN